MLQRKGLLHWLCRDYRTKEVLCFPVLQISEIDRPWLPFDGERKTRWGLSSLLKAPNYRHSLTRPIACHQPVGSHVCPGRVEPHSIKLDGVARGKGLATRPGHDDRHFLSIDEELQELGIRPRVKPGSHQLRLSHPIPSGLADPKLHRRLGCQSPLDPLLP